jgi:hypothetical protein
VLLTVVVVAVAVLGVAALPVAHLVVLVSSFFVIQTIIQLHLGRVLLTQPLRMATTR